MKLPGNVRLPDGEYADALAVAPDGATVYVGLGLTQPAAGGVRVLTYTAAWDTCQRHLPGIYCELYSGATPAWKFTDLGLPR